MDAWNHWFRKIFPKAELGKASEDESPKKGRNYVLTLVTLGILLLLLSRLDFEDPSDPIQNAGLQLPRVTRTEEGYESDLERRLERWLAAMENVGSVEVLITIDQSERVELAMERTEERSFIVENTGGAPERKEERITERPVLLREDQGRSETPIVVTTYSPVVRGVVVLAQGAYDPRVRYQIIRAVQTALGVPAHRVEVLTKKE